jgi:uncharacterized DUF497 family protein
MQFDWDESNEDHIALHGISRSEVEEALSDPLGDNVGFSYVDGEERFRYVGATIADRCVYHQRRVYKAGNGVRRRPLYGAPI